HAALGQVGLEGLDQLGKVAVHGLLVAAAEHDVVAVAEGDAAEAVPLGLVEEAIALRQLARELGQHGLDRRADRQLHARAAHATSVSASQLLTMDSIRTSHSAARAQP